MSRDDIFFGLGDGKLKCIRFCDAFFGWEKNNNSKELEEHVGNGQDNLHILYKSTAVKPFLVRDAPKLLLQSKV